MPIAKLADLKARLGISDSGEDALLTAVLEGVSALFDAELERTLLAEDADITETHDGGGWDVRLRRWPVTSVVSVKEAADYDWASATALAADSDYRVDAGRGVLTRLPDGSRWLDGPDVVQVIYRGGYWDPAQSSFEFDAVPAHIQEAALLQAQELYRRIKAGELDATSVTAAGPGGSVGRSRAVGILPLVKTLLRPEYR